MAAAISVTRTEFTVSDFLAWQRAGGLNLSPSFQRRSVWKAPAKSYLIDTVVRGLPTPIIFLRKITDTKTLETVREVVDGQQRLRTLLSFIDKTAFSDWDPERDEFTVARQHNKELAGKRFSELDERIKKQILGYEFSAHVLPNDTSDAQVLDIFRRMNATGTKLNKQELRNAKYFGEFIQSVYKTAHSCLEIWRAWNVFSEDAIARMDEAEFVSEVFMMMLRGVSEKSQTKLDSFYDSRDVHFPEQEAVEQRFQEMISFIDEAHGDAMADSALSNRIVLYPLLAALYDLLYGFGESLAKRADRSKLRPLAAALEEATDTFADREGLPADVQEAMTGRSSRRSNRLALTGFLRSILAKP